MTGMAPKSPVVMLAAARQQILYTMLRDAAARGLQCPSNRAILKKTGLKDISSVPRLLDRMASDGLIRVQRRGNHRRIEVCAIGMWTADTRTVKEPEPVEPRRSIGQILEIVAQTSAISVADIKGRSRDRLFIRPRVLVCHFAKQADWRYTEIARALCRDHSTIIHACQQAEALLDRDPLFRRLYARVEAALAGTPESVMVEFKPAPPAPTSPPAPAVLRPIEYDHDDWHQVKEFVGKQTGSDGLLAALRREHPRRFAA